MRELWGELLKEFGLEVAAGLFLIVLMWILRRIGWGPAVRLWELGGRWVGWIRDRVKWFLSRVNSIMPNRRYESIVRELESLRAELVSLREQVSQQEAFGQDSRWLELQNRRDAYVRVCRELAPRIRVDNDQEPKLLVRLLTGVSDDAEREYFWLVPSGPVGKNKWVVHPQLSKRLSELYDEGKKSASLGVMLSDGRESILELRRGQVTFAHGADNNLRAFLDLTRDSSSLLSVADELTAMASILERVGSPASSFARQSRLIPTGRRTQQIAKDANSGA